MAGRFRCDASPGGRQIFTERFAEEVLAPSARRTTICHSAMLDRIMANMAAA